MKKIIWPLLFFSILIGLFKILNTSESNIQKESSLKFQHNSFIKKEILREKITNKKNTSTNEEATIKTSLPSQSRAISSTENTSKILTHLEKRINPELDSTDTKESPQAVLDWSADIGFMMIKAFEDPQYADKVFRELQSCSDDNNLQMVFRAICAANMKRLSDKRSDAFAQRYLALQHLFPKEIQDFLNEAYTQF